MTFQERRAIASLIGTVLITALYALYMAPRFPQVDPYSIEIFRFWGGYIVVLIPVSIVAKIIIFIIFHIINAIATQETEPSITDERDRSIDQKATRNSMYVFIIGFGIAMASLVFDQTPTVMFIILMIAGISSEVVSDLSQFYFYRRGY